MNITEKITMLNNHLEMVGSDRRYWITDNRIFVCYNATTDEDDIDEISIKRFLHDYNDYFCHLG